MEEIRRYEKRWEHQKDAEEKFLQEKNGILEMATGTGKTYTAIRIMKKLLEENKVERIIVITYGNDLLQQWYQELLLNFQKIRIFRFFHKYKEYSRFISNKENCILIMSREPGRIATCLSDMEKHMGMDNAVQKTLLVFDEIHGLGSLELQKKLSGKICKYKYRLGLSATPERDFDEAGNAFIKKEVGEIIYRFGLKEAIEKGILCSFSYIPIFYNLTEEERKKKQKILISYEIKRKEGMKFDESELYRDLARVNKKACRKIPLFEKIIIQDPDILNQCIIFVEDRDYGLELQKMLIRYIFRFHTYYSEDTEDNLSRFGNGEIDCLITCKKISEGIDIRSVKNIVLFSSDKGKIATIQRIGRSLRKNPDEPEKQACIIDFIYENAADKSEDITTDRERMKWLSELAKARETDETVS
mgnify:CR=1 FL=1